MLSAVQLEQYFKKVGLPEFYQQYSDNHFVLSYENLRKLMLHHVLTFPFENIDMHNRMNGKNPTISRQINDIFHKMVVLNRGGYCYETNGLLGEVMRSLGYKFRTYNAGVLWMKDKKTPPYHLLFVVNLGPDSYLVDAGFGGPGPLEPLLLTKGVKYCYDVQTFAQHDTKQFRIVPEAGEFRLESTVATTWRPESQFKPLYSFSTAREVTSEELDLSNGMVCCTEQSPFLERLFITKPIVLDKGFIGRVTLTNSVFKVSRPEGTTEIKISSQGDFLAKLKEAFGIELGTCDLTRLRVKFEAPVDKMEQLAALLESGAKITYEVPMPTPALTVAFSTETPTPANLEPTQMTARAQSTQNKLF